MSEKKEDNSVEKLSVVIGTTIFYSVLLIGLYAVGVIASSSHSHSITGGITEGSSASTVNVYIDGELVCADCSLDGSGINVKDYVSTPGEHQVTIESANGGRVNRFLSVMCT